jgi:predicted DNA-binding protein
MKRDEPLVPMLMRVRPERAEQLRELAGRTRIPQASLLREALADLIQKYEGVEARGGGDDA